MGDSTESTQQLPPTQTSDLGPGGPGRSLVSKLVTLLNNWLELHVPSVVDVEVLGDLLECLGLER